MRTDQPGLPPDAEIERLYQRYQPPILLHLFRLVGDRTEAEDLCQETFLKALRGWPGRDPQRSVVAWLYRIATNTAYDHLRWRRRTPVASLDGAEADAQSAFELESRFVEGALVQTALVQLPICYRVPLVLAVCEGRSTQEIAETLGCSSNAIKMRLWRARGYLRRAYQALA